MNLNNPFDYIGIDTIRLYVPISNLEFEEFSRVIRIRNGQRRLKFYDRQTGVKASEFIKTDGFRYYIVRLSLSRLFNVENYSSYSPFDYEEIVNRLNPILIGAGLLVKDWTKVILSRIDVFLNIELKHSYTLYKPILNTITLPRTEPESYNTTKYLKNKSITLMTYDKKVQLKKMKNVKIEDNVMRIELRYLKGQKIKNSFGTNLLYELKAEQIEKDFYKKLKTAFAELGKFSFYPTPGLNLKSEFVKYFKEKKARFPRKLGVMTNFYYWKQKAGKFQEIIAKIKNAPVQSNKSLEAQRKKKERDIKKAQSLMSLGVFIDFEKRKFGYDLDLIRNAVFHRHLKIARIGEDVKTEQMIFNKDEGAMDLSMFSWNDVQRILLKAS